MKLSLNTNTVIKGIFGLCLGLTLLSCKKNPNDPGTEFAPQMYLSVPYEPYSQAGGANNEINPKGINLRHPAKGTIPRRRFATNFLVGDSTGGLEEKMDIMVYDDIAIDDYATAGRVLKNPYPHTDKVIAEGKVLYTQFCYPCHGEDGGGKGPVAEQYKGVANLNGQAYTNLPGGHIYHVITNGKGRMWPHGSQVNPDERWKIVHYVLELQGRNVPKDIEFTNEHGATFTLNNVLFETGSANLDPYSRRELDRLAIFLKENPSVEGEITGHTDDTGEVEKNQTLSNDRAKAVFDYLIEKGVSKEALKYVGKGATEPVASNETEEGKAQNRRIEFYIL